MGFLNVNEKRLKKRLHKAEKAHAAYVKEVEKLKETYFEIYDKNAVELLIGPVSRFSTN